MVTGQLGTQPTHHVQTRHRVKSTWRIAFSALDKLAISYFSQLAITSKTTNHVIEVHLCAF